MDTRFVLQGITFIWDENKARENPLHHDGMTFEQAAEAFFDPFLKVVDASRNEEARDAIIGMDTRLESLVCRLHRAGRGRHTPHLSAQSDPEGT